MYLITIHQHSDGRTDSQTTYHSSSALRMYMLRDFRVVKPIFSLKPNLNWTVQIQTEQRTQNILTTFPVSFALKRNHSIGSAQVKFWFKTSLKRRC